MYRKIILSKKSIPISISVLLAAGNVFSAVPQYVAGNSYKGHEVVSNNGSDYECLSDTVAPWCSSSQKLYYEPGKGLAWSDAWKKVSSPQPIPLDQHRELQVPTPDNLPDGAKIEFIDPNGTQHFLENGIVMLDYAIGGSNYKITLNNASGTLTPNSYTVTNDSKAPLLEYKEQPKPPVPSDNYTGTIPSDVKDWKVGPWPNDHYNGGDFASYDGYIWQAQWWTQSAPGTDDTWNKCIPQYVGHLKVNVSGINNLSDVKSFPVKVGDNFYQISRNGGFIDLPSGTFDVSVQPIVEITSNHAYVASVTPTQLNITQKGDYTLNITFKIQNITSSKVAVKVIYSEQSPSSNPLVTINSSNGYNDNSQSIHSGINHINVPNYGTYNLQAATYKIGDKSYAANNISVSNEKIVGSGTINYQYVNPRVLAGYLPVSWGNPIKISEAARNGYNIVLPAFVVLDGNKAITFVDDHFLGYGGWNAKASDPKIIAEIKADVNKAKSEYGLKYVLASVGGENNTFKPIIGDDQSTMARNVITFLDKYGFDGIDFDLEGIPSGYTAGDLADFIKELKKQKPSIIISSAPQVNNVSGSLGYVNTGTEQVYNVALNDRLFNYMFVQEYNTGSYSIDANGDICSEGSSNCHDQTTAGFIPNSFQSLEKITPKSTLIVPGEPATKSAAGAATVFNGADADTPYKSMAAAYEKLQNEPQFGGAMTWDIGLDSGNNYTFAKTIAPAIFNE